MLHAIIMAGGSGTRFWPASRKAVPKQCLPLAGERTMIQETRDRLGAVTSPERTYVITAQHLVDPIAAQLPELPAASIVGEPCRRDTAPCVGLAATMVDRVDPDGVMLVCPSDHVIRDHAAFAEGIRRGEAVLADYPDSIVTFGIRPSYPAESFGYIQRGEALPGHESLGQEAFRVAQFREKPDRATAEQYLAAGSFAWNSGIFMWRARTILDALRKHEPDMAAHLELIGAAMEESSADGPTGIYSSDAQQVLQREFAAMPAKSIDYAVMERHPSVIVIEAPFDWDDVGSWQAVARLHPADKDENVVVGGHVGIDSRNCIVHSEPGHTIVTIDMSDVMVVQTKDATLVAPKSSEERVREAVRQLEALGRTDLL